MSLLIKGMNMPDSCRHCRFCIPTESDCDDSPYECVLNDYLHWATWLDVPSFVSEGCQLIKLPTPHGRLIDADRLIAVLKSAIPYEQRTSTVLCMIKNIENAPTVIEAEEYK